MKVLITGAAGFIGSNLADFLLGEGHFVVGIDNFITGSPQNIERLKEKPRFNFFNLDVALLNEDDKKQLGDFQFQEIYHLACPTGVPNLTTLSEEMLLANSYGVKNILDIALACRSKIIVTSSSEVYGDPKVFPQREDYTGNVNPVGLRSPYEEGKRFAESLFVMYYRKYNLDARIVRVFNTYGPYMSEKDERVVPRFIKQLSGGEPLTIHGDGTQKRTFCYISDLMRGLMLALRQGTRGEVYNIGGSEELTVLDLARLLIGVSGVPSKINFVPRPAHDHQARRPDLSKIASLGWSQKISLEEGLSLTLREPQSAKI